MGLGPLRPFPLLEPNTGGGDLLLQRDELELTLAQQGEVPVIGRTQALQQGNDGVMTGRLFPPLYAGDGHGLTDTLAQLPLGQPQVFSPAPDEIAQKDQFHNKFLLFLSFAEEPLSNYNITAYF